VQHQYYLVESHWGLHADNELNYIGIGLYEAWLGSSRNKGLNIATAWKAIRWQTMPTVGTFYWFTWAHHSYDRLYQDALKKCPPCEDDSKRRRRR